VITSQLLWVVLLPTLWLALYVSNVVWVVRVLMNVPSSFIGTEELTASFKERGIALHCWTLVIPYSRAALASCWREIRRGNPNVRLGIFYRQSVRSLLLALADVDLIQRRYKGSEGDSAKVARMWSTVKEVDGLINANTDLETLRSAITRNMDATSSVIEMLRRTDSVEEEQWRRPPTGGKRWRLFGAMYHVPIAP
jgi:hypothetical protein